MRLLHILVLVTSFFASAQIDHWESVVLPGDQWNYLVPSSQPSSSWNQLGYNSSSWSTGNSGFGYGDGDDATVVSNTISTENDLLRFNSTKILLVRSLGK